MACSSASYCLTVRCIYVVSNQVIAAWASTAAAVTITRGVSSHQSRGAVCVAIANSIQPVLKVIGLAAPLEMPTDDAREQARRDAGVAA